MSFTCQISQGNRLVIGPITVTATDAADAVWAFELGPAADPVVQLGPDELTVTLVSDTAGADVVDVIVAVAAGLLVDDGGDYIAPAAYSARLKSQVSLNGPDDVIAGTVVVEASSLTSDLGDVSSAVTVVFDDDSLTSPPNVFFEEDALA